MLKPGTNTIILISFGVSSPQLAARFALCGRYFDTPLLAAGSFISLLWVYRLFYDEKYQRVFEPKYKSQYLNEYQVTGNIAYITKEEDLLAQTLGNQILTDNPSVVYKYFPYARKMEQFFPDQS